MTLTDDFSKDQVDIWTIPLVQSELVINSLYWLLSDEEKDKLIRFHFSQDRHRFIICHGAVRRILSNYVGVDQGQIKFDINQFGKPFIRNKLGALEIQFNLTHSEDRAVLALTPTRNIGVDIEFIHPFTEYEKLAANYFSPEEKEDLESSEGPSKLNAFYKLWTRKEAFLKAIGKGLSFPLNDFSMLGKTSFEFQKVKLSWRSALAGYWYYIDLQIAEGYASSMVIEGDNVSVLKFHQWVAE
ncbi:MAG: 4'-phosphopantetheinyl transferase superfamily protein [Anaerolineaceae bacterium]|nr:4'-phosphopantetheinyl transferase superfamily protein [Anaerolineaceae bacterium]